MYLGFLIGGKFFITTFLYHRFPLLRNLFDVAFYFYRNLPTTTTISIKQQKCVTTEITPLLTSNSIVGRYTSPYVKAAKWLNSTSIDSSSINIRGTIKDSIKSMNNDDRKKKVLK